MTAPVIRRRAVIAAVVAGPVSAVAAWAVTRRPGGPDLAGADRVVLVSADGRKGPDTWPASEPPAGDLVHGYPVLGRVEVTGPAQRPELSAALAAAIGRPGGPTAACFWPRHVLRIEHGGRVTDSVICSECRSYQRYVDGQWRAGGPVSPAAAPAFDAALRAVGVPVAPPAG